jgi:hypothetical protein
VLREVVVLLREEDALLEEVLVDLAAEGWGGVVEGGFG